MFVPLISSPDEEEAELVSTTMIITSQRVPDAAARGKAKRKPPKQPPGRPGTKRQTDFKTPSFCSKVFAVGHKAPCIQFTCTVRRFLQQKFRYFL